MIYSQEIQIATSSGHGGRRYLPYVCTEQGVSMLSAVSIGSTQWSFLSWSHFKVIMRVADPSARDWYIKETAANNWSTRTLERNIARYSILKGNEQIFASKYKLYLPTEEELAAEIAREKELIQLQLQQESTHE